MDCRNNLPSPHVSSDGLAGISWQDDTTESRSYYQGMSVETLDPPGPAYFSRSNADQNSADIINPLSEFRVASLTQDVPDSFDEYVPWKPDKESDDDELFPALSSYLCHQSLFSWNEPDIREPTSANRLSPDHRLSTIPTELANPQDSRPVAVVEPLNLQQATSDNPVTSAENAADKTPQTKRKSKNRNDLRRERYQNDPTFAERERTRQRERQRERRRNSAYLARESERYRNDPAFKERQRERQRERQKELRKNPAYLKRLRERYQNDPAFAERERKRQRERQRELRKNPAYVERERERLGKLKKELGKNPAFKEHKRELARKRRKDPEFAERQRKRERDRQRKRYQNDPAFAERRRERQRELRKKAHLRRELKGEPKGRKKDTH